MLYKRIFDFVFSIIGLLFIGWLIVILTVIAFFDTGGKGLFFQERIGQYAKPFSIFKIRTIHVKTLKISSYGMFLRAHKLDELPQLINVLIGQMSFVGPRPDVMGYYDCLQGDARKILELKPGLCSLAALKYYNEEALLTQQENPREYNDNVVFPDKLAMNLEYYHTRSLRYDMYIIGLCAKKIVKVFL